MNFIKIFKNFDLENVVNKILGEGKLKAYDEIEKIATRWLLPSENLSDFFDEKYNTKKQIFQLIIIIILWITPIKWLIELIVYQTYDYHAAAYYTSYFGMANGKDEVSFTILGILIIFCGNYFHSFCKLFLFVNQQKSSKINSNAICDCLDLKMADEFSN